MPRWSWTQWIVAVLGAAAVSLIVGIPTGVVPTPFYTRMIPVPGWSYAVWLATSVLSGLLLATYVRRQVRTPASSRAGVVANVGSLLAVGCPVCNKLVVAVAGVGGALNVWAPMQPLIAAVSLLLLGWALWRRLSVDQACPISVPGEPAGPGRASQAIARSHPEMR